MHVKAMDRHQISLSFTLYLISGVRGFHFYPEFIDPARVASQMLWEAPVSASFTLDCRWAAVPVLHLCGCWRSKVRFLSLHSTCLTCVAISPAPGNKGIKIQYQSLISNMPMFQFIGILITLRNLSLNIGICNCIHVVKLFFLYNLFS